MSPLDSTNSLLVLPFCVTLILVPRYWFSFLSGTINEFTLTKDPMPRLSYIEYIPSLAVAAFPAATGVVPPVDAGTL